MLATGAMQVAVLGFIFGFMAIIAVVGRLWSRRIMNAKLAFNDYAAIAALVFAIADTSVFLTAAFAAGLGVHLKDVPPETLALHLKLTVPAQILWAAANTCVKASILTLYIVIFPSKRFKMVCLFTLGLSVCYFITVFLEAFLLCTPVSFTSDKSIPGQCANVNLAYLIAGITNLCLDALVVVLPMPMLWGLQLPFAKKAGIAGMFGLGAFICIISLLRVTWLVSWDLTDLTYTVTPGACWSLLECTLGVVNACLPMTRKPIQKLFGEGFLPWSKASQHSSFRDLEKMHDSGFTSGSSRQASGRDAGTFKDVGIPLADIPKTKMSVSEVAPASCDGPPTLGEDSIRISRGWDIESLKIPAR